MNTLAAIAPMQKNLYQLQVLGEVWKKIHAQEERM